ncbi:DnaB-like helicase C-terminal domain-containing protein [Candidatus Solirubrobacter pratensis]|uniref:DnaB-like helicase C-terminal domain-containing protein n=1 Tax=Candidatus Solirubrobacter pratensis TaxID=1298857 RepID=UPI000421BB33|nr:DnaB-like helicase C-terminal domain-containing protein [Candidatus Solirubrobacter pratensis]
MTEQTIYELDIDLDLINHLAYPDSVGKLQAEQVKAAVIFDPLAKRVFKWQMQHVRDYGEAATPSVLEDEFADITLDTPETQINDLILRLRTRYLRSEGKKAIREISELAITEPMEVARAMSQKSRELLDLTVQRGEVYGRYDFPRARQEYDKAVLRGKGPSLGYDELDDHFHGQVGVTFLIAPPKTYKSWVTINTVLANVEKGFNPYLYSLELPSLESYWRLACMAADVPYWKYLKRSLMPDELRKVESAAKTLDEMGNFRMDKPNQGSRSVAQLVDKALDSGADCIIVDQLQYIENRKGNSIGAQNSTADYFEVVNDLRNWSDLIPVFVVHQFNRSVMSATAMPEMQQAKGSSAIEEVATLSLGLWANKDMRRSNVVELGTLASRNYGHASWELGVQLSRGCRIEMKGEIEDVDE